LGHGWHDVLLTAPSASENVPGQQSMHTLAMDELDHFPWGHAVHVDALPFK
jgi:hypothetical protein